MSPPSTYVGIVRRGETETFRVLQADFAQELDLVEILWDRREAERRTARQPIEAERRRRERRRSPPGTWAALGFVLARRTDELTPRVP